MTAKQFDALGVYIRQSANLIGLREWEFTLESEPCEEEFFAQIFPTFERSHARIRVERKWNSYHEEEKRKTIAHELTHCFFDAAWQMIERDLDEHLIRQAHDIFCDAFRRNMEFGIESVADQLQRLLNTYPGDRRGRFVGKNPGKTIFNDTPTP